jgi:hypothetical protein
LMILNGFLLTATGLFLQTYHSLEFINKTLFLIDTGFK